MEGPDGVTGMVKCQMITIFNAWEDGRPHRIGIYASPCLLVISLCKAEKSLISKGIGRNAIKVGPDGAKGNACQHLIRAVEC